MPVIAAMAAVAASGHDDALRALVEEGQAFDLGGYNSADPAPRLRLV